MVNLRFFGPLREVTGTPSLEVEANSVAEAVAVVTLRYGDDFLKILERSRVWVNGESSDPSRILAPGDEVAILPPVSGGS